MEPFRPVIDALRAMPPGEASLWILAENLLVFLGALAFGHLTILFFRRRLVHRPAPPLERAELWLAAGCVACNTLVTVAGFLLWKADLIRVRMEAGWAVLVDFLVLFGVMDFMMYVLHRLAHHPWFYGWLHRTHHRYESPRPLTLFVMNPLETLSFGMLWLALLLVWSPTWIGMTLYLTLNVVFGILGHVGVEPFPGFWVRVPVVNLVASSTFHHQHHRDRDHNFGFYTAVWDRLFGSLAPSYAEEFGAAAGRGGAGAARVGEMGER